MADLARDGGDGLHLAVTAEYERAVLDVMLPRLDGWQVLREIRLCIPALRIFRDSAGKPSRDRSAAATAPSPI